MNKNFVSTPLISICLEPMCNWIRGGLLSINWIISTHTHTWKSHFSMYCSLLFSHPKLTGLVLEKDKVKWTRPDELNLRVDLNAYNSSFHSQNVSYSYTAWKTCSKTTELTLCVQFFNNTECSCIYPSLHSQKTFMNTRNANMLTTKARCITS